MRPSDVERFRWPPGIEEKVWSKHGFRSEDVEDAFFHPAAKVLKGRKGALYLLSRTEAGAYIFVVFTWRGRQATIITARSMNIREKRQLRRP